MGFQLYNIKLYCPMLMELESLRGKILIPHFPLISLYLHHLDILTPTPARSVTHQNSSTNVNNHSIFKADIFPHRLRYHDCQPNTQHSQHRQNNKQRKRKLNKPFNSNHNLNSTQLPLQPHKPTQPRPTQRMSRAKLLGDQAGESLLSSSDTAGSSSIMFEETNRKAPDSQVIYSRSIIKTAVSLGLNVFVCVSLVVVIIASTLVFMPSSEVVIRMEEIQYYCEQFQIIVDGLELYGSIELLGPVDFLSWNRAFDNYKEYLMSDCYTMVCFPNSDTEIACNITSKCKNSFLISAINDGTRYQRKFVEVSFRDTPSNVLDVSSFPATVIEPLDINFEPFVNGLSVVEAVVDGETVFKLTSIESEVKSTNRYTASVGSNSTGGNKVTVVVKEPCDVLINTFIAEDKHTTYKIPFFNGSDETPSLDAIKLDNGDCPSYEYIIHDLQPYGIIVFKNQDKVMCWGLGCPTSDDGVWFGNGVIFACSSDTEADMIKCVSGDMDELKGSMVTVYASNGKNNKSNEHIFMADGC